MSDMAPQETTPAGPKPRLYHAPPSYYSMIARLALAEAGIAHEQTFVDIHLRGSQQAPDYVRLNPNMTVPTLVLPGRTLDQSRDILLFSRNLDEDGLDADTRNWIDLHDAFPVEELTFGLFLTRHRLARVLLPAKLAATRRRLLKLAAANPDLAEAYRARAAVFAGRARTLDPAGATRLAETRRAEAVGLLDRLDRTLADRRDVLVPPRHGIADVAWTVFLARMEFLAMADEIAARPALARYWTAMRSRAAFAAADIWTELHVLRLILGIARG